MPDRPGQLEPARQEVRVGPAHLLWFGLHAGARSGDALCSTKLHCISQRDQGGRVWHVTDPTLALIGGLLAQRRSTYTDVVIVGIHYHVDRRIEPEFVAYCLSVSDLRVKTPTICPEVERL